MREVTEVLEELESWLASERPDLLPRLRPGLSELGVEELETRLAPYRLPADLVTVYQWHDGWDPHPGGASPYVGLMYDCSFHALEHTIELYEILLGIDEPEDVWNPLWFPAFGEGSGEFVELQPGPNLPAGLLWSFHSHAGELHTAYDSVASLFRTTLELWRAGMLPSTEPWVPDGLRAFVAAHNPVARHPDGRSRLERLSMPSLDWPKPWLIAAGIARPSPADDDEVITIAEFLTDPWCERPVRGEFRCSMGSASWSAGTLTDETGSIKVHVEREMTENFRLFATSNRVEMILTPVTEGDTVEESMAQCELDDELERSVTRRFLEASAAAFDAIRVVPLPNDP
jgi:cell wall assembly regulator SMI1